MDKTRDQILLELNKATHGPLGQRSLAMTLRKAQTLILALREDSISWQQIADLLNATGHSASAESIRRSFTRTKSNVTLTSAASQAASYNLVREANHNHALHLSMLALPDTPTERSRGPPAAPAPNLPHTRPTPDILRAGGAVIDTLEKLKELDQ